MQRERIARGASRLELLRRVRQGLAGSPWTVPVPAGGRVAFPVAVCAAAVGCWYDLTVSEAPTIAASGFQRRFMGRMETGVDTISDPAMAAGVSPNAGRPLTGIAPLVPASGPRFVPALLASAADASAAAAAAAGQQYSAAPSASPATDLGARGGGGGGAGAAAKASPLSAGAIAGVAGAVCLVALGLAWRLVQQQQRGGGGGLGGGIGGSKRQRVLRGGGDGVGEVVEVDAVRVLGGGGMRGGR